MEKKTFREVKYPAIYKHFKNKYYATMGVSKPINSNEAISLCQEIGIDPLSITFMSAKYTENNIDIRLLKLNGQWHHLEEVCRDILVIYKSLYDGSGAYARPIEMFLSKVDKEKYPNVKQEYRFEEIK